MKKMQTDGLLFGLSVIGFTMMSFSFVLMPIEGLRNVPGLLFWAGLIGGIALQIVLEVRCREFLRTCKQLPKNKKKTRIGLLTFGSNTVAKIIDILLPVSIAGLIISMVLTQTYGDICFVFVAATLFTLSMHWVLNGRIYQYVRDQINVRRFPKPKEEKTTNEGEGENE